MSVTHDAGPTRLAAIFLLACFLVIGYYLYVILRPFFSEILWAGTLTVIFLPLYRWILRKIRGRRNFAALITCVLILLLIVLPVFFLGVMITEQSITLYQTLQGGLEGEAGARFQKVLQHPWVQWILSQVSDLGGPQQIDLRSSAEQVLRTVSRYLVSYTPSVLRGLGSLIASFLLIFISMFFFLRDGRHLVEVARASNPLPTDYETEIIKRFKDVAYATFVGSILTAVIQGIAGAILFWALGIVSPLFWGAVIAFVSLVPIVGAFLVWLPWTAYLLLTGHTGQALTLLLVGGLGVSSIDNIIKPLVIQGRTNMHPLLVFLSVLGGMQAFGFLGIMLGPLTVALFLSFLSFYKVEFRETLEAKLAGRAPPKK
jgi:predicted PurR-regulated permease PerM